MSNQALIRKREIYRELLNEANSKFDNKKMIDAYSKEIQTINLILGE